MKFNPSIRILLTILGLSLIGASVTAQAQATTPAPAPAAAGTKPPAAATTLYTGTITAISGKSVTVATAIGPITITISSTTKIAKGEGINGTMADFAVGDTVKGRYTTDASGAMTATKFYRTGPKKSE